MCRLHKRDVVRPPQIPATLSLLVTRDKRDLSTTSSEIPVWAESLKGARKRYDRAYVMLGATLRLSHTVEDDACAPGHSRLRRVVPGVRRRR
jgi:hypothetical protein